MGSFVRVYWPPPGASSEPGLQPRFLQDELTQRQIRRLVADFAFLNPHLTLTVQIGGEEERIEATDTAWEKWTPSSPTSPHWYEHEQLERLIGAYVTHDRRTERERTVREFVVRLQGADLDGQAEACARGGWDGARAVVVPDLRPRLRPRPRARCCSRR